MNPSGIRYTGARLGVFGLQSWEPLREPGQPVAPASVNFGSQSSRQLENVPRSATVRSEESSLQQRRREPQSAEPYFTDSERVGNSSANGSEKNSNGAKPRE